MTQENKCTLCDGTGLADYAGFGMETCDPCGGTGKASASTDTDSPPQSPDRAAIEAARAALKRRGIGASFDEVREAIDAYLSAR